MSDTAQPDRITRILDALAEVYEPEGIGLWLFGRKRQLDGEAPIDLLRRGEYDRIEQTIDQLQSGAFV